MAGKSKVELDHLEAALGMFGNARSGQRLRSKQFVGGNSWVVDILVDVDGLPLIIEYDGVYWHTGTGLRPLPIHSPQYLELLVHPDAPRPAATMHAINDWLSASHIRRLSLPAETVPAHEQRS